ncbi:lamin tail domain-containing protein [Akkermansiaceae bacterium]|nr:lamin tail domain-containing protein [Akkermansiaceae bacterium]
MKISSIFVNLCLIIPIAAETTHRYLFMGHPRDDQPGEIVQRDVERVDYSFYDLLLLGGDYTWRGTGTRDTVDYLDEVFSLSSPKTLTVFGNHDSQNKSFLTDKTGRPAFYAHIENNIVFLVLDTTDNSRNITGAELTLIENTVDSLTSESHLVLIHHHLVWLSDYAPLSHLQGSPLIGASSNNLSGLNFHSEVYPLLLEAKNKGAEVICLGGDRTGSDTEEFFIDHTTADGIRFIGAGLKEELTPSLRTVVVLEHDLPNQTLTPVFQHLTDLPSIADEQLVINELHYNPAPAQGNDHSFIELFNRGSVNYDLSLATFSMGIDFTFPANTFIAPGEYFVIAADDSLYSHLNTSLFDYSGTSSPTDGESIILRNKLGLVIDAVDHDTSGDWPSSPNNGGPSLMLIASTLDNSLPSHWAPSDQDGGTPGTANIAIPSPAAVSFENGDASLSWDGIHSGATYVIEYTESPLPGSWQQLGLPIQASNSSLTTSDPAGSSLPMRFYRLGRSF